MADTPSKEGNLHGSELQARKPPRTGLIHKSPHKIIYRLRELDMNTKSAELRPRLCARAPPLALIAFCERMEQFSRPNPFIQATNPYATPTSNANASNINTQTVQQITHIEPQSGQSQEFVMTPSLPSTTPPSTSSTPSLPTESPTRDSQFNENNTIYKMYNEWVVRQMSLLTNRSLLEGSDSESEISSDDEGENH
eukprot:TRINITY_DN20354_c0_g1_i1.p1 TRINITY_DN20354_c0_g1~~TRINITY_DN20354_c0_g1_i1.p1  ORF type:complete len:196 (-),score=42.89 TRINITY_DN20354_c0_g1_i1:325-912(-)